MASFEYLATHPATSVPTNPMAVTIRRFRRQPRIEEHPAIEIQQLHAQEDQTLSPTAGRTRKRAWSAFRSIAPWNSNCSEDFPTRKEARKEMKTSLLLRRRLAGAARVASAQIYAPPQTQVYAPSRLLQKVGINQKMGAQVPLDLPFADESGRDVTLRQYFGKPVILALVYYQCPSLCNMVLNGVVRSVKNLELTAGERISGRRRELRSARDAGDGGGQESRPM